MHTVRRLPTVALGRAARRPRTAEPGDRRVIVAGPNGRTASNKKIEHLKKRRGNECRWGPRAPSPSSLNIRFRPFQRLQVLRLPRIHRRCSVFQNRCRSDDAVRRLEPLGRSLAESVLHYPSNRPLFHSGLNCRAELVHSRATRTAKRTSDMAVYSLPCVRHLDFLPAVAFRMPVQGGGGGTEVPPDCLSDDRGGDQPTPRWRIIESRGRR